MSDRPARESSPVTPIPAEPVHTHGPEDGPGLACRETVVDGRLVGACRLASARATAGADVSVSPPTGTARTAAAHAAPTAFAADHPLRGATDFLEAVYHALGFRYAAPFPEVLTALRANIASADAARAASPDDLRAAGWAVAVHNDYRLNGRAHTVWLFTHPNGRWAKGEGATDADALAAVRAAIAAHPPNA